jgi:hypothetical protein
MRKKYKVILFISIGVLSLIGMGILFYYSHFAILKPVELFPEEEKVVPVGINNIEVPHSFGYISKTDGKAWFKVVTDKEVYAWRILNYVLVTYRKGGKVFKRPHVFFYRLPRGCHIEVVEFYPIYVKNAKDLEDFMAKSREEGIKKFEESKKKNSRS